MTNSISFLEAKFKIEAYCAYQERSPYEVEKKLSTWQLSYEQTQQLLADLIANNFLNEERFACAFVSGKFRIKHWGRIKIKAHLKQKNISNYSIDKGLKEIEHEDYIKTAIHLLQRKSRELVPKKLTAWEEQNKLCNYLASKGYETDIIFIALDELRTEVLESR